MLLGQNKLLFFFLQVWHGKDFTAMTAHRLLKVGCFTRQSLLTQPQTKLFMPEEEDGSHYFYPLLMLLWLWGGFFTWLLEPQRFNSRVSAGGFFRADQSLHSTGLSFPPLCLASQLSIRQLLPLCCSDSISSQYFISFCGGQLVIKSPCCSSVPQSWIF